MLAFVIIRDILIAVIGIWYFEFHLDFTLPKENNLLLFFVAIPVVWATLTQIWLSVSYKEQRNTVMLFFSHVLGVLILASTVFLISAILNTIAQTMSPTGSILFHGVGWTTLFGIIFYDVVDLLRSSPAKKGGTDTEDH
ncbi:hypothetical protein [Desulfohalobium retbaense]|uniref:Uncharacterized protein n=1 Tax=Desulfohalobium retbaense (strain ATCC 49708 / DSM 5692 / JCM 16813 / HR100) TaxID=485915 RepID=C8X114_DESRD|nr:hypothetical protein [Desulfohalobium retbaense]ACV68111.1 hypothetical protein Dret_0820 [Desulfohalobium retbaense DSM 5692]